MNQEIKQMRNFCIISHVDHGKSTLADRFLELTNTVDAKKMRPQFLDAMDLERERGITIKMQPVRMEMEFEKEKYILNLIDTPGHVDFSYEVSRSLAAVEGAVLLVDAVKGIQAQTIANLEQAQKQNLVIIPVINKIDLSGAQIEEREKEITTLLGISKDDIIKISAKQGLNIKKVLEAVIKKVPSPLERKQGVFRALVFDSKHNSYKGVVACVRIIDGEIKPNDKIVFLASGAKGEVKEVGFFKPDLVAQRKLGAGDIGYIATGVKESQLIRVGDTITKMLDQTEALPGYKESKPVIFISFYPKDLNKYEVLKESLEKLRLNDASFSFEPEFKEALGRGFRCGFLGSLHAEIISERLRREFLLELIATAPSVVFRVLDKKKTELIIRSATDWLDPSLILEIKEPWARLEVMTPQSYFGPVMELLNTLDGEFKDTKYFTSDKSLIIYEAPLRKIITGFYDRLKGATQGYASLGYEILEFRKANLVKLEILIANQVEEAFSKIVSEKEAYQEGKKMVEKLKEILPNQQFSVALQAAVSGKIIARETIKARRKDVTASLYGGDYTRKKKLLERQKKGKKDLKESGRVRIPQDVFFKAFRE